MAFEFWLLVDDAYNYPIYINYVKFIHEINKLNAGGIWKQFNRKAGMYKCQISSANVYFHGNFEGHIESMRVESIKKGRVQVPNRGRRYTFVF